LKLLFLINTDVESPPKKNQVFGDLKEINGVNKVYNTNYSIYDFVAEVQTKAMAKLKALVFQRIREIDAVESTTTLVVAKK
jgi:DNA-binding Lrp family transcriptional regulator